LSPLNTLEENAPFPMLLFHFTCSVVICHGLDLKCPHKVHVWKAWSPVQQCSVVGPLGGDNIWRAVTHQWVD
jgi:hypothetical protein